MSVAPAAFELDTLLAAKNVSQNLSVPALVQRAIERHEVTLAANGAIAGYTSPYTGRTPKDKFVVKDSITADKIAWGGVNQPFDAAKFDALYERVLDYLKQRDQLFVQDLFCGADPTYQLPVRFFNQYAWHNLFVKQLFVRPAEAGLASFTPQFTVLSAPEFKADPQRDGTRSEAFVIVNFTHKLVILGGTKYAGELKKCIFGIMNFLLPQRDVFPMHCSANMGQDKVTALFFGLSGTGKTTLSADPNRGLIGDDEHGWSKDGIFNFEGGCYAKMIKLSKENEPQIFNAIRFGCVLENLTLDAKTGEPDYNDQSRTENTRGAYPVDFIENAVIPGVGGHPKNVIFLTADAFGVLPPISRLNLEQAQYHFMSGYTAKLAGTETGVTEPQPNFSTCFGAPFMPLPPKVYAEMLRDRLQHHDAQCWLVNTGWTGGGYGVGNRFSLKYTRAMITALLNGDLLKADYEIEPAFGFSIPTSCPGVPKEVLSPRNAWRDKAAYDQAADALSAKFAENFKKFDAPESVKNAAPRRQK
ncbi:MAG: phosphoenolpyruvate carboxykinase (ATP) [Acidobacteriaceae bacterium]